MADRLRIEAAALPWLSTMPDDDNGGEWAGCMVCREYVAKDEPGNNRLNAFAQFRIRLENISRLTLRKHERTQLHARAMAGMTTPSCARP